MEYGTQSEKRILSPRGARTNGEPLTPEIEHTCLAADSRDCMFFWCSFYHRGNQKVPIGYYVSLVYLTLTTCQNICEFKHFLWSLCEFHVNSCYKVCTVICREINICWQSGVTWQTDNLHMFLLSGHFSRDEVGSCYSLLMKKVWTYNWSNQLQNYENIMWIPLSAGRFNYQHAIQYELIQVMAQQNHQKVSWRFGLQNVSNGCRMVASWKGSHFILFAGWNSY